MRKYLPITLEEKIIHAENNRLEWYKCIKYIIILCGIIYLLAGCNVGMKNTSCPSHNSKFFFYNGKQPKWYKH